ncbi:methyl-accepting chemotaxis protein (Hemerythrin family protein) [Desulforapulum autotrophicum HRM2]|uniref:Methyl-accepting chemotaxis protein (Hemerythrin family protein) n=1 Tax=Desulforapulum autotrophicum (strain ATCC 43914 / DSM 3382 / VKM B-1955 / HRM2) TaxID=177437 RepID=C0QCS2_DESAH|nr:bacteriohemerythrin [Desulforapulum autotrophicum]ACN15149.1 methyl-accepting chemotaxis protein (Hemerythrin family protein) [Desulforapulum autotrophicum HRM2]
MEKLDKIEWDEKLSVDIPEIDELQKKMFALLNVLIDLKLKNKDAKECSNMVAEINEYSRYFFSKEEEYLRKAGYPEIDTHAKEHRKFIKNTISLRRQVTEDKDNLNYEVIRQMRNWLVDHIITSDLMYVPFLRTTAYLKDLKK